MSTEEPREFAHVAVDGEPPVDAVQLTETILEARGLASKRVDDDLHLRSVGLVLSPRVLGVQRAQNGGLRTVSIVRVQHRKVFPTGIFEYQHGFGDGLRLALEHGLNGWAELDLPVLVDATRPKPLTCNMMKMDYPAKDGRPAFTRRLVLGPPAHYRAAGAPEKAAGEGEHCFCPCCLTTRSFEAFRPLIEAEGTYGLRLYAARDASGEALADCRVNGEDFAPGKAALAAYAATWPYHGVEFRKQYVVIQ